MNVDPVLHDGERIDTALSGRAVQKIAGLKRPCGEPIADRIQHVRNIQQFILICKSAGLYIDDLAEVHIGNNFGVERGQRLGRMIRQGEKGKIYGLPGLLLPFLHDLLEGIVLLGHEALVPPDHQLGACRRSGRRRSKQPESAKAALLFSCYLPPLI